MSQPQDLLRIERLSVVVHQDHPVKSIVREVAFNVPSQTIVALVGGSGSGKTTVGLSILGLLPPALKITEGRIIFQGSDLLKESPDELRRKRGKTISMVFQEPLYAFNPLFTIGDQIEEVLLYHSVLSQANRKAKMLEFLNKVGISDPQRVARSFPHQLSGGMRQRAMIAQAIIAEPSLVIADEPTSNLDVTLQARVIELFLKIREELGFSVLLITHDLGMVRHMAREVVVMQQGRVVETGQTGEILKNPGHAYTAKLIEAAG